MIVYIGLRRVKTIGEMRALLGDGSLDCRPVGRGSACELVEWTLRRFLKSKSRGQAFLAVVGAADVAVFGL